MGAHSSPSYPSLSASGSDYPPERCKVAFGCRRFTSHSSIPSCQWDLESGENSTLAKSV